MKNNAARLLLLHILNLIHSRYKGTYNIINYKIYYKIFFKKNDFFSFVRSTISIFIIAKRFLKVTQQLVNGQWSMVNGQSSSTNRAI